MKFTGQIAKIKLDRGSITATFEKNCQVLVRNAAREWLRTVVIRVPVWTGMARGALKFAKGRSGDASGQFLSTYLRVAIPIGPTRTVDGKPLQVREDKSPELGGAQSRYQFTQSKGQFGFSYSTQVKHLLYNDFFANGGDPSPSAPWGAFEAGERAFNAHIKANAAKTVPNLADFVQVSNIKIG